MAYTVWTVNTIDDEACVLAGIPTRALADRLVERLSEIYGDDQARVEED